MSVVGRIGLIVHIGPIASTFDYSDLTSLRFRHPKTGSLRSKSSPTTLFLEDTDEIKENVGGTSGCAI